MRHKIAKRSSAAGIQTEACDKGLKDNDEEVKIETIDVEEDSKSDSSAASDSKTQGVKSKSDSSAVSGSKIQEEVKPRVKNTARKSMGYVGPSNYIKK